MKGARPKGHLLSGRERGQQGTNSSPAGAQGHKAELWDHPPPRTDTRWMQEVAGKQKTGGFQQFLWELLGASSCLTAGQSPGPRGEVWGRETAP